MRTGGPSQALDQVPGRIESLFARLLPNEKLGPKRDDRLGCSDAVRVDKCSIRIPMLGRARF